MIFQDPMTSLKPFHENFYAAHGDDEIASGPYEITSARTRHQDVETVGIPDARDRAATIPTNSQEACASA